MSNIKNMVRRFIEVMDAEGIKRVLKRIAVQILEKNKGSKNLVFIGLQTRGVPLAHRLSDIIYDIEEVRIPVGILDVTLYRDDLHHRRHHPEVKPTKIDFNVEDRKIILVDEVLYTGRTIRAAMDAIMDLGRPSILQLAVLIDRGHRELPIAGDYIGKIIPTSRDEWVCVRLKEIDGEDIVLIDKLPEKKEN